MMESRFEPSGTVPAGVLFINPLEAVMIRLSSSFSRKTQGDEPYSSIQYHSSVEAELPSGMSEQELRSRIRAQFQLVERAVDEELAIRTGQAAPGREERPDGRQQRQESSAQSVPASNRQISYILSLGKAQNKPLAELNTEVGRLYGVESVYRLSRPDASRFVDVLKKAA